MAVLYLLAVRIAPDAELRGDDDLLAYGPYISAVSKNVTPRSTAARSSAIMSRLSGAGPYA